MLEPLFIYSFVPFFQNDVAAKKDLKVPSKWRRYKEAWSSWAGYRMNEAKQTAKWKIPHENPPTFKMASHHFMIAFGLSTFLCFRVYAKLFPLFKVTNFANCKLFYVHYVHIKIAWRSFQSIVELLVTAQAFVSIIWACLVCDIC